MQGNLKDKYLIPAIYSVPWAIGLLNSVFCFVSTDSETVRKIIAAFSVYTVFFLNTLIDIFLLFVRAVNTHVKPFFAYISIIIFFLLLFSIIFARSFYNTENIGMIIGVIITIILSYYFMAIVRHSLNLCFTDAPVKRRSLKSNLR